MIPLDFYQFYAVAEILREGGNIYDLDRFTDQMLAIGWPADKTEPGLILYPPWSIYLYFPLAYVPFELAYVIWTALSFVVVIYCLRSITDRFFQSPEISTVFPLRSALFSVGAFIPFYKLLLFGQATFFSLLSLYLFSKLLERRMDVLAGAALSLSFLKPHLLLALYVAVILYSVLAKRPRLLLGCFLGIVLQTGLSLAIQPHLLGQFWESYPSLFERRGGLTQSSAWGQLISQLSGWQIFEIIVPLIGIAFGFYCGFKTKITPIQVFDVLVPVSLITTPYAWSHDYVLLFPAYLYAAMTLFRDLSERTATFLLLIQALVMSLLLAYGLENYTVWFPVAVFLLSRRADK